MSDLVAAVTKLKSLKLNIRLHKEWGKAPDNISA